MSYATYADFNGRYPTKMPEAEINSHFLFPASARLDSLLAPYYTVPFSVNNLTAQDLTIDLAYLLLLHRAKDRADSAALADSIERRIEALREGTETMMTAAGETLYPEPARGEVWSTTQDFKPIFDLRDPADQEVDPDRLRDEDEAAR